LVQKVGEERGNRVPRWHISIGFRDENMDTLGSSWKGVSQFGTDDGALVLKYESK